MAKWYAIAHIHHILFIHSFVEGLLGCIHSRKDFFWMGSWPKLLYLIIEIPRIRAGEILIGCCDSDTTDATTFGIQCSVAGVSVVLTAQTQGWVCCLFFILDPVRLHSCHSSSIAFAKVANDLNHAKSSSVYLSSIHPLLTLLLPWLRPPHSECGSCRPCCLSECYVLTPFQSWGAQDPTESSSPFILPPFGPGFNAICIWISS